MPTDDATGFTGFFQREYAPLVAHLVIAGFPRAQAEDAAAEAMVELHTAWDAVRTPRAWVRKVAWRVAVAQRPKDVAPVPDRPAGDDEQGEVALRVSLTRAMGELPPRQREVMAWTLDGFRPGEIAEQLGRPVGQVRANLAHARRALRTWLTEHEGEGEVA